jgi:peptide/nickel transport system permease protein
MSRYVLRRLALGILTLAGVSLIVFVAARLSGDVTYLLLPPDAPQEEVRNFRAELGLDQPLPVQYLIFLKDVAKGDFGRSLRYKRPVVDLVFSRLPATIELAAGSFLVSAFIGLLFGVTSATRRGAWVDTFGKFFAMLGQSMPNFWLGIMAILIFSVKLGWLPTSGRGGIQHLVLPALTLGWFSAASILRITRSSMLDVLDSDYIKTARLKGNPEWLVVWKHALRNALIPVVSLSGIQLAQLLGGAVITESVFGWPGLGSLILDAVYNRDYPLVQAGVLVTSIIFISLNLIVDLLYGLINPRIRYK